MTTKIKAMLAAAAAIIIAGGIAVNDAIEQARIEHDIECREWSEVAAKYRDPQLNETFYLAFKRGQEIPKASAGRVLGDCAGGVCTFGPTDCQDPYQYRYDCGPFVDADAKGEWRVCEVNAPLYIAGGWRAWAKADANRKWWGSFAGVVSTCKEQLTGAQCLQLLQPDKRCWLLSDGQVCRYGALFGPGQGGTTACPYANVVSPMPCTVYRGAGSEMRDAIKTFEESDFD